MAVINGDDNDNTLHGTDGDDVIRGHGGDDSIDAGAGRDLVYGGDGNDTITGGGDNDELYGGAGADLFRVVLPEGASITSTTVNGGSAGDDADVMNLGPLFAQGFEIVHHVQNPESNGAPGFNGQLTLHNAATGQTVNVNYQDIERIICFTTGTRIATPRGAVPVEQLRPGDRVFTRDNGLQELRWIGRRQVSAAELTALPHLRPVVIRAGSLGENLPERDLVVSPNHRVLLTGARAALAFAESEVLAAAQHLLHAPGFERGAAGAGVTYVHLLFDQHEVILSDGLWSESFQPGDYSLKGLDRAQRDEILTLFPELSTRPGMAAFGAARRVLKRHEARLI